MEELGYKVPRMAKFPFVITFGDKPTVSGCGLVILKINLAKPHTLSHVAFVEIDDWTKIMTSEEDEGVEIIKRPDEVDDNLVGLTIEIAADEVIEVIKI